MTTQRPLSRLACVAFAATIAVACSTAPPTAPPEASPEASAGAADSLAPTPRADDGSSHVLHSETLRGMMTLLRSTRPDRFPQELEGDRRAEDAFHEIERAAVAIHAAARRLPGTLPAWGLAPGEREEFEKKAADLGVHALALEQAARRRDQRAVDREEAALAAACHACHARFRPRGDESGIVE